MSFGRRNKPDLVQKAKTFIYPVGGYTRWARYLHLKLQRLPGSPHSIALGFACGVGASFTPLVGLHFVTAGLTAWAIGGNILASAFGTAIGNPWTFPLIWIWTWRLGMLILGRDPDATQVDLQVETGNPFDSSGSAIFDVFVPMMVGGLPTGLLAGLVAYLLMRPAIAAYQGRRRARLEVQRQKIADRRERRRAAARESEHSGD